MVSSHRRLVHRRNRQILSGATRDLQPGEVRLFSYYAPSLAAGEHTVVVSQTISAPPVWPYEDPQKNRRSDKIDKVSQTFVVAAPKFSLPPDCVDSVYPAPGSNAEVRILPHIVLKDPHLPWERWPTYIAQDEDNNDDRRRTPWLALLVFTVEELSVEKASVDAIMAALPEDVKRQQSDTFALRMRARHTPLLAGVTNAISYKKEEDDRAAAEPVDVILLQPDLFSKLFSDDDNGRDLSVSKYKHLAHVRQTATDGMAVAGNVDDNEDNSAIFSVVVSPRTSVIGADVPTTTVVHLVSLAMTPGLPVPLPTTQRVAVVSLHSWTYTCLPSKGFTSTFHGLEQLGAHLKVLQPQMPDYPKTAPLLQPIQQLSDDDKIASLITKRQRDGYNLVRHRTVTGESTAAMIRGPLTPTFVVHPLRDDFVTQSNFGTDLQILDAELSLMDITYASAWQLGKTLAMGDEAFGAALTRLRNAIHSDALGGTKKEVHTALGAYRSRSETARAMLDLVRGINQLNDSLHEDGDAATAQANSAAQKLALATNGQLYNEHNVPDNPDYGHVYSWILDKLHLGNIPAHYLLPDPSFLPEETLRFFFVDENWTDALVDGALSLANHWGATPKEDYCRTAIKKAINTRLSLPDKELGGWHTQMPKYGFMLRSQILAQFPDISVTVRFSAERPKAMDDSGNPQPTQASILVQKRLSPDTMYCLFDCAPPGLTRITFTLPPHQQRFVIGQTLDNDELAIRYKKISTVEGYVPNNPEQGVAFKKFGPSDPAPLFDWKLRTMNVANYGEMLVETLKAGMVENNKELFTDTFITSGVLALQLNDPILELIIGNL
ncbi:hypothetical protein BKA56DRAFT_713066, partial [Ilyonectria sp. MPI-CAGE-AT-0026]